MYYLYYLLFYRFIDMSSDSEKDVLASIGGMFVMFVYIFLGAIMPIYATFKDYQVGKIMWASIDFIFFPVGTVRGLMYLFGG